MHRAAPVAQVAGAVGIAMGLGAAVGAAVARYLGRRPPPGQALPSDQPPPPEQPAPHRDAGPGASNDELASVAAAPAEGTGKDEDRPTTGLLRVFDRYQRRHPWAGFPYAVVKKLGDDQGGNLAALLAYYAFLSIFPLLLAFVTILGFILDGRPELQRRVLDSALLQIPVLGEELSKNVGGLDKSGVALAIGLVGALWGGMGVANAGQTALNQVWEVPKRSLPSLVPRVLRSAGLLVVGGIGVIGTTFLSGMGSSDDAIGLGVRVVAVAASVTVNIAMFSVVFRILTVRDVGWRQLFPGAVLAAVAWQVLQSVGSWYIRHQLDGLNDTYGIFAIVLGLLSWLYLEARIVLLAAEVNVVLAGDLWPRGIGKPLTRADRRALKAYAEVEERRVDTDVDVSFT